MDDQVKRKGICLASRCALYNQEEDSTDHIFLRCVFESLVWNKFAGCFEVGWRHHQLIDDLMLWWKGKARSMNLKQPWLISFSILAANIWWERNRRIHDATARPDWKIFDLAHRELVLCLGRSKGEAKSPSDVISCRRLGLPIEGGSSCPPLEVHWCKPQREWIKINVDGSSLGNPGRAGVGGIARDSEGQVCDSFSIFLGTKKIYKAEFAAVMEGILMAKALGARGLWIESDSGTVVAAI
ncbi:uncharacterized protein LOC122059018 [Macadamia integrifolia]|uniref:uncharacterized protein LOC122059018 n=1 Tax=Macadamia integrifolia TaxID=60698 RepID=UPI001C52F5DE|nr:uncharacterized protein LOC122059018 [Macadamia integrifolia]